jgi:hypothetical protein
MLGPEMNIKHFSVPKGDLSFEVFVLYTFFLALVLFIFFNQAISFFLANL